ncbi:MAG: lipid-transfer protein [Pseudomonas sp.]|nr:lipid-transfer protein [Pseudomonas sp.]
MNDLSLLWAPTTPPSLLASRQRLSDEIFFPAVTAESPLSHQFEAHAQFTEGELYSYTIMHPSPKSGQPPFVLAYLNLPGPLRLFGRVRGSERPQIGQRCRVVADETFGFVFELMEAQS